MDPEYVRGWLLGAEEARNGLKHPIIQPTTNKQYNQGKQDGFDTYKQNQTKYSTGTANSYITEFRYKNKWYK